MKKLFKIITFALILSFVVVSLCSCGAKSLKLIPGEKLRSVAMISMASDNMNKLDSYNVKTETKMYIDGVSVRDTTLGTYMGVGTDDYRFYEKSEIIPDLNASVTQKIISISGYQFGKMYRRTTVNGNFVQKLYSEISLEDYLAFEEEVLSVNNIAILEFTKEDAEKMSCEEQDDGTWKTTISDFSDDAVEVFYKFFNSGSTNIDFEDVEVEFIANEDLLLTNVNITFIFDVTSRNSVSIKTTYSDFDNASFEPLNIDGFKQVDDLTVLERASNALEREQNKDSGSFELMQKEMMSYRGQRETASETFNITYNTDDDKFSYEITTKTNDTKIVYENGEKKTYEESELKKTEESDDLQERASIGSLKDPMLYDSMMVSNITIEDLGNGETLYIFRVGNPYGAYYESYASMLKKIRGKISSSEIRFEFKMKDSDIVCYKAILEIDAVISNLNADISYTCNCDYSK